MNLHDFTATAGKFLALIFSAFIAYGLYRQHVVGDIFFDRALSDSEAVFSLIAIAFAWILVFLYKPIIAIISKKDRM